MNETRNTKHFTGLKVESGDIARLVIEHQSLPITEPKVNHLLEKRLPITQQSNAWHAARDCHITASDVAAVLGQNRYSSRTEVILRKLQQYKILKERMAQHDGGKEMKEAKEPERDNKLANSAACKWGQEHESEAAALYSYVTGVPLYCDDIGLLIHPSVRCVGATPDALARDRPVLVEIKTPYRRKIVPGSIPTYYIPQVQVQMEICDIDVCHFVQYIPATTFSRGQMDILEIERNKNWWANVAPNLRAFWKEVVETATSEDYSDEALDELTRAIVERDTKKEASTSATTFIVEESPRYRWRWPPSGRYDITVTGDGVPLRENISS